MRAQIFVLTLGRLCRQVGKSHQRSKMVPGRAIVRFVFTLWRRRKMMPDKLGRRLIFRNQPPADGWTDLTVATVPVVWTVSGEEQAKDW
jgi:hypothetical protein